MEKITTSADVTAAFTTWYADKTPANLNHLMTACRFPAKLAFRATGAKLRRRRDLDEDDLFHAGLIDIWKTIIRNADAIHEFTKRPEANGLVKYFMHAAKWGMLRELNEPTPTCTLSVHHLGVLGKIMRAQTGDLTDQQLADATQLCTTTVRNTLDDARRHRRLDETTEDGEPQAWTPGRYDRNLELLENRELCARGLRLLNPRDRRAMVHVYLRGDLAKDQCCCCKFEDAKYRARKIIARSGLCLAAA